MKGHRVLDRLEQARALDPVADGIRDRVLRVLCSESVRDALHGVWLGHPLHPALVHLPVGAWLSAALLDRTPKTGPGADVLIGAGLVSAVPAAAAGLADFAEQHEQHRRVGVVHATANTAALTCYGASLAARLRGRRRLGGRLSLAGLSFAGVGAFLGGHLSFRLAAAANHAEAVPHLLDSGWHPVARVDDLVDCQPTASMIGDVPVLVLRRGVHVDVLADRCSHLAGPLHEGRVEQHGPGVCLRCPWHGSTFRLEDGAVVHGPATAPQPRFEVWITEGTVHARLPGAGWDR
jgi:nitrite reductase/ring-hydroxylating ferredoxin subunit